MEQNKIKTTISLEEKARFDQFSTSWWEEKSPYSLLHAMNPCRLSYIKACVARYLKIGGGSKEISQLEILDIGCGGGILTEPLSRLGAKVTGIDMSESAIALAKKRAEEQKLPINYLTNSIENLEEDKTFDLITALEIIEHVSDTALFIASCKKRLKKGGLLFVSTLNRTWFSYITAILGAEYILNIVPRDTHSFKKFIKPSELNEQLLYSGMTLMDIKGMGYSFSKKEWFLTPSLKVNYITCSVF